MNDERIVVADLINIEQWNRAGWKGVVFAAQPDKPPLMALAFRDGAVGKEIFTGLRSLTGEIDSRELLRVAIIEGEIPGEQSGYTVHLTPNVDALAALRPDHRVIVSITRFLRMNPAQDSQYLANFKRAYAAWQKYWLLPATLTPTGGFEMHVDHAIGKTLVVVKDAAAIGQADIDKAIFVREQFGPTH